MPSWPNAHPKLAALLELAGVFITGTLLARLIGRALGVRAGGIRDAAPGQPVDYLALASSTAVNLLLRYGIILGLAFLIGWWHRRRGLASYGITTAGLPARSHLAIGLVLFALGGFLPKLLIFAKDYVPLGRSPGHWEVMATASSFEFWVYMAVSSFGLVPIVEELFFRGYVQTRLGDAFGTPAAIVMASLLFTLSHRQYFLPSVMGVGMLLSLFAASMLAGYVRHRFGSLLPGVLAHALGNVPVRGWWQAVLLALMVLTVVIARRAIPPHLRELLTMTRSRTVVYGSMIAVAVVMAVLAVAAIAPSALLPAGALALLSAIALEARDLSRERVRAGE